MNDDDSARAHTIPVVDYLDLTGPEPRLISHRCRACGARFFDRRNACASCGKTEFEPTVLATTGTVRSFSVVYRATPDVEVPYVSALVELDDGKAVKANLAGVENDPNQVVAGLRVELTTWPVGQDPTGTTAVTFGFRPLDGTGTEEAR
jgi:uncharacterized OB-fold protein